MQVEHLGIVIRHFFFFGFQLTVIERAAISLMENILGKPQHRVVSFDWPTTH